MSSLLLVVDLKTRLLSPLRSTLATIVSPIYVIAETPYQMGRQASATLSTRETLIKENEALRQRNFELAQITQQFVALREENARLRQLLGSRQRLDAKVLVAELIGVVPSPTTFQVEIDKGNEAGVFVGQAVIDADGVFGQVVEVAQFSSRVMLLVDSAHALPVQVNRNDFRSIAAGTGRMDRLELEYVPITADIRVGDTLVSSGLGGHFPPGYPVAEVTSMTVDPTMTYAQVIARPLAALDRSRHVLLVFASPPDVRADANASGASDAAHAGNAPSEPRAASHPPASNAHTTAPGAEPPPTTARPAPEATASTDATHHANAAAQSAAAQRVAHAGETPAAAATGNEATSEVHE